MFPEEAGEKKNHKGRKVRIIPYLPGDTKLLTVTTKCHLPIFMSGKKLFSKGSSLEIAEKRLPEMAKYTRYKVNGG